MCFTCKLSDSSALACLLAISQTHISNKAQNKAQSICMNIWLHLNLHYMATFRWNQHKILNIHQRAWRPMFFLYLSTDTRQYYLHCAMSTVELHCTPGVFCSGIKKRLAIIWQNFCTQANLSSEEESKCYRNTWNNFLREYTMSEAKVYYEV